MAKDFISEIKSKIEELENNVRDEWKRDTDRFLMLRDKIDNLEKKLEIFGGEAFINEVVARINKKQVK